MGVSVPNLPVVYRWTVYHPNAFRHPSFLLLNKLSVLRSIFCTCQVTFLLLLSRFIFLVFQHFMCLGVHVLEFILLGISWASCICRFICFIQCGKFWPLFSQMIFLPSSLFLLLELIIHVYLMVYLMVSYGSLKLSSLFFMLFSFCPCS